MNITFKCSKCNGDLICHREPSKREVVYQCIKCKRKISQIENTKLVDMDSNNNEQVLYE